MNVVILWMFLSISVLLYPYLFKGCKRFDLDAQRKLLKRHGF